MVDILSIGTGAVNAYRQALSTTSNNIANVNTPGYSRRELVMGESFPVQEGAFSFGSGAQANAVARAYDEFIEKSLRDATSGFESNKPLVEYANRIVDIIASESSSLSGAIEEFFNKAQTLTTDPSSRVFRREFLNTGALVASRFNDLSLQLDEVSGQASQEYKKDIDSFNALSSQLLTINRKLASRINVSDQPPSLLDERDALLRGMSELAQIGVTELTSGQVVVNFGGSGRGSLVVTPSESVAIGMIPGVSDLTDIGTLVLDPGGSNRPLPKGISGSLGGSLALNSDVLSPVMAGLDHLAVTFATEINAIHRSGLDLQGDFGRDMFSTPLTFQTSQKTARGDISFSAEVFDLEVARSDTYQLMYREHTDSWDVSNFQTGERLAQISHGRESQLLGINFSVIGRPVNGDTLYLTPENRAARSFSMLIDDVDRVAVAASMRATPSTSNSSLIDASVSILPNQDRSVGFENGFVIKTETQASYRKDFSIGAGGNLPVFQFLKGTVNAKLQFEMSADSSQDLHLFTKEGVYVAGTSSLTAAEANALIGQDGGFGDGSYSNNYLNGDGSDAYLDSPVRFGATSSTKTILNQSVDPDTNLRITQPNLVPAQLSSKNIIPDRNVGSDELSLLDGGVIKFTYQRFQPLDASADADGFVSESFDLSELALEPGQTMSAAVMATYFTESISNANLSRVTVSASNVVRAQNIDLSKSLSINGIDITFDATGDAHDVLKAINQVAGQTGVRAGWNSNDSLFLTNTSGNEGENIVLDAPGIGDSMTALGLAPGVFTGTYEISTLGVEVDGITGDPIQEKISLVLANDGKPSDLGRLGLSTDILIDGGVPDDLAVFVSGTGQVEATLTVGVTDESASREFPADSFVVTFTSDSIYTITDIATDTIVTTRLFDSELPIVYRGVSLSFSDIPKSGDSFTVGENTDGIGSNENFLRLIDLGKEPILNGQTFSQAYGDLVSGVGARSRVAEMNRDAMGVIREQAEASRESVVGVNLDEEAADLIRFQQAYQAAAQVIQTSQRMFDTLVQIG